MVILKIKNLEGFRAGSRVICVSGEHLNKLEGIKGTVLNYYGAGYMSVEWDEYINGHRGDGERKGKMGFCWTVHKKDLLLI